MVRLFFVASYFSHPRPQLSPSFTRLVQIARPLLLAPLGLQCRLCRLYAGGWACRGNKTGPLSRPFTSSGSMSHSKFEYVRRFESDDRLLPNAWIVVRIDGKGFHKFSQEHSFQKPNDVRALDLMNACAASVLDQIPDVLLAYGQSDEYSFVLRKDTDLYSRRSSKIVTTIVSHFAAAYVFNWAAHFPAQLPLQRPPSFDGRAVLYPSEQNLRDYLSWRQADCHINNLYNTTFWALVKGGMDNRAAQERLKGTFSNDKNEILFSQFGINYNEEPIQFRKGTIVFKMRTVETLDETSDVYVDSPIGGSSRMENRKERKKRIKTMKQKEKIRFVIQTKHCDIIGDDFWEEYAYLLKKKDK